MPQHLRAAVPRASPGVDQILRIEFEMAQTIGCHISRGDSPFDTGAVPEQQSAAFFGRCARGFGEDRFERAAPDHDGLKG